MGVRELVAPSPYRAPDGETYHRDLVEGRAIWRAEGGQVLTAIKEEAGQGWRYVKPEPGPADKEIEIQAKLRGEIDAWRGAPKMPAHRKLHEAEKATVSAMEALGRFHLTPEGFLYWFRHADRTLYELSYRVQDADAFVRVLSRLSGVNPEDAWMRRLYAHLRVRGPEKATPSQVHRLAYWDGERLYVDRFDGSMYRLDGQEIQLVPNGTNGILFLPEPLSEPYEAALDTQEGAALDTQGDIFRREVAGLVKVDETRGITQGEGEDLMEAWVLASFFRATQPTRPILSFWGPKGTTKTTTSRALGRTLLGPDFDVTAITRHKEDAFQAKITQAGLAVFDNADGKISWLPDGLATLATGGRVDRRQLYRTILLVSYPIQAWAIITSRDPQFGRDDVAERLLLIPTARPPIFRREGEIQAKLAHRRNEIWGSLLECLQSCVRALREGDIEFETDFRMADFAVFFLAIQEDEEGRERVRSLLRKQTALQDEFIAETTADLWLSYLLEILEAGPMVAVTAGEIVKKIAAQAKAENVPIKLNVRVIGSTLKNAGPNLRTMSLNVSHRLLKGRRVYDLALGEEGKPSELLVHQIHEATKDWATLEKVAAEVGEEAEKWLIHLRENGKEEERDGKWRWVG